MLPVEDGDVADQADELAFGGPGDFFGYFFLGFLEFPEFHFDQFVVGEGQIDGADQLFGDAFGADDDERFQVMRLAAQIFSLSAFQGFHDFPYLIGSGFV